MAEKKATRAVYGEMLVELAEKDPELIVLDAELSSATMTRGFARAYPERFLDMGIAEANMIGVAAGLATCGKKPFANSFAMFTAGRAYEQVRNSVAYPGLNVKCVGSHGGLSVGEDGATHQCLEDLALMSAIPGMLVLNPCDGNEMRQAVLALIEYVGPAYMRLGRMAVENVTDAVEGYKFELGKAAKLREGSDLTICATGLMVQRALAAAEALEAEGISARVLDFHTVKPIDKAALDAAAKETGCIVTTEEHSVMGGLGSAIAAYIAETNPVPVLRHGVYDEFGRSGTPEKVLEAYGLTAEGIAAKARAAVAMKR